MKNTFTGSFETINALIIVTNYNDADAENYVFHQFTGTEYLFVFLDLFIYRHI